MKLLLMLQVGSHIVLTLEIPNVERVTAFVCTAMLHLHDGIRIPSL